MSLTHVDIHSASLASVYLALAVTGVIILYLRFHGPKLNIHRPPGPKGHFLWGNAKQLPPDKAWEWYTELSKQYGSVMRLTMPGTEVIVLNTIEAVQDLFMKRSTVYSDRPRMVVLREIIGAGLLTPFMVYGDQWRTHRKLWHNHIGPQAIVGYHGRLRHIVLEFVSSLHEHDSGLEQDVCGGMTKSIVRNVMAIAYGVDTLKDGTLPMRFQTWGRRTLDAGGPGNLAELIPALKYVPSWMPGAGWKRKCEELNAMSKEIADKPYYQIKRDLAAGIAANSMTRSILESNYDGFAGDEEIQKWVGGSVYSAGVNTTQGILRRFIYNMIVHPEMQERAQAEIESVTEGHRLPTFADAPSLPYMRAILAESLRWRCLLPLSTPHRLMKDDVYNGFHLKAGSIVLPNMWAISNNPEEYPDPEKFQPERYLGSRPALDPGAYVFGVGRRVCAGRDLADANVFLYAVTLLATSNLRKSVRADGTVVEPEAVFVAVSSVVFELMPFECFVEARSDTAHLLHAELDATVSDLA